MPRTVDHAQRRADIVAALLRLALRAGLPAVSLRAVATEAGVSLRLVQYYFETKAGLMRAAFTELERRSHERWDRRLGTTPDGTEAGEHTTDDPRACLEAFVDEALPSDEPSRAFHRLWMAYAAAAATDPDLPQDPLSDGPLRVERRLADTFGRAHLPAGGDPDVEAARLLNLVHGLGTGVLSGQRSAAEARTVLRYHLDRVFGD